MASYEIAACVLVLSFFFAFFVCAIFEIIDCILLVKYKKRYVAIFNHFKREGCSDEHAHSMCLMLLGEYRHFSVVELISKWRNKK